MPKQSSLAAMKWNRAHQSIVNARIAEIKKKNPEKYKETDMSFKKHDAIERKSFKFQVDSFDDEAGTFTGYASVFGGIDSYGDTVIPGAFKKTLKLHGDGKFPLTWSHNQMEPLGLVFLKEDKNGLRVVQGEFNMDVQSAREKRSLAKQGAVTGLSIGFRAVKYDLKQDGEGRNLEEIALSEVGLCLFPADEAAQVNEVKADDAMEDEALEPDEGKPYPNNHDCVIDASLKVVGSMKRKHEGKEYTVRIGKKPDGGSGDHSYLYPKDTWTEAEARAHCKAHQGTFEPAKKCDDCNFDDTESGTRPGLELKDKGEELIAQSLRALIDDLKQFKFVKS